MARIRNIKPDFFKDEDLAKLPFEHRLFFEGLWCHADRDGRLEYRPERLKVEIMPYDQVDVRAICERLADPKIPDRPKKRFISIYEVDGEWYLQVLTLKKHQKFHNDEKSRNLPSVPVPGGQQGVIGGQAGGQEEAKRPDSGFLKSESETENGCAPAPSLPPGFNPDKINSDTPLPPLLQGEWNAWLAEYPEPHQHKDQAIRLFVKHTERWRVRRNTKHYRQSKMVKDGIVYALDTFLREAYRDFDEPGVPLGTDGGREELRRALKYPAMPGGLSEAALQELRALNLPWQVLHEKVKARGDPWRSDGP